MSSSENAADHGLTGPALATCFDMTRASTRNPAPFATCQVCGFFRPVYPETDGTEVCLDCYEARNGRVL